MTPEEGPRVLVVARATTMHRNAGGMETAMVSLVSELKAQGASLRLVTTSAGPASEPSDQLLGLFDQVWPVRTRKPGRYSLAWWLKTWRAGPWWRWRPDVVLSIGDAAASMSMRTPGRAKLVVHAHGTTLAEAKSAVQERSARGLARAALNVIRTPSRMLLLRRADAVWAAGPGIANQLAAKPFQVDLCTLTTIPNAVDENAYAFAPESRAQVRDALGMAEDDFVCLSLGRIDRQKGVDLSVAMLSRPEHSATKLLVGGDGPEVDKLKAEAQRLGVNNRIEWVGRVPSSQVRGLLSAADVLVFPTRRHEGLPMIFLEAASAGLPVVTTVRGQSPVLDEEVVRIVIAREDSVSLAVAHMAGANPSRRSYLPQNLTLEAMRGEIRESMSRLMRAPV